MLEKINRRFGAPWMLLAMPLAVMTAFYLLPLLNMFLLSFYRYDPFIGIVEEFSFRNYSKFLTDPFYLHILLRTLRVGLLVTLLSILLGFPVAYGLYLSSGRRRVYLTLLVLSPLLVSVVVRSFGWLVLLGPNGLVNSFLQGIGLIDRPLNLIYTEGAVVVGLTHVFLAFMVLSLFTALENIDPAVMRAAENLGATRWRVFWRITFPLSLPGLAAGSLIVFTLSTSAFITPALLGGPRVKLMSYLTYQQTLMLNDWPFGSAIAAILLVVTGAAVLLYMRALEKGRFKAVFR